jgi:hypothetical protein
MTPVNQDRAKSKFKEQLFTNKDKIQQYTQLFVCITSQTAASSVLQFEQSHIFEKNGTKCKESLNFNCLYNHLLVKIRNIKHKKLTLRGFSFFSL